MKEYKVLLLNDNEVYEVYDICASTLAAACKKGVERAIASVSYDVDVEMLEQHYCDDCASAKVSAVDLNYMTDSRYFFFAREFEEKDEDLL